MKKKNGDNWEVINTRDESVITSSPVEDDADLCEIAIAECQKLGLPFINKIVGENQFETLDLKEITL